jgi:DNA mismatch endonuclease (patch repair protein)
MQANVGRETTPERKVRSYLHCAGFRFRKDLRPIAGLRCTADLVFRRAKVCILVDGCFWHGCPSHFKTPKANSPWWHEKIEANRARDRRNDASLAAAGWQVFRLWEHDVKDDMLARLAEQLRRAMRCVLGDDQRADGSSPTNRQRRTPQRGPYGER